MHPVLRGLALVVVAVVAFAANAYAQHYWVGLLFPHVVPRPYAEMVSAAIVGALAAGAVSAFPLAKLFAKRAWIGGVLVALPVVALRAPEIGSRGTPTLDAMSVMAWVEMVSYTVAVVFGAWLLSRRVRRVESAL